VFERIDHARGSELIRLVRPPVYAFQRWQVIDRERDVILVDLGGQGEYPRGQGGAPDYFNLICYGMPVAFEAYTSESGLDGVRQFSVDISKITFPEGLKDAIEEIKKMIPEALMVYWISRRRKPANVKVHFPLIQFY
jgi:hypothetical protein